MTTVPVPVHDIQFLSERQIRRETHRSAEWVKAHAPLMPGCDYTPTGQRRVPRICVQQFIREHRPETCRACNTRTAGVVRDAH